jgi:hypothetical protein
LTDWGFGYNFQGFKGALIMAEKQLEQAPDVELDLGKLLGFKRVTAAGDDQAELARTMEAILNKVGSPEGGCT